MKGAVWLSGQDVCLVRWGSRVQSQGGELKIFKWPSSARQDLSKPVNHM